MPRIEATATITAPEGLTATAVLTALGGTQVAEEGLGEPGLFEQMTPAWEAVATIEADGTPGVLAVPPAGTVQEAGIEIYVDDELIPMDSLVGQWQVSRNKRENVQSGSFTVALDEWGQSPLGDPWATLGSPTGKKPIDFIGVYRDTETGNVYRYPLLPDGIADNVHRESGASGHTESYQVLDKMAAYTRTPVTFIVPPGHGLPRGRMVRKIFEALGETGFFLEDGGRSYKDLQLVDANGVAEAQQIVDIENRVVRRDRFGRVVNPTIYPSPSKPSTFTITEEDILSMTVVSVVFPADVITEVTATGTEQIHSDEPSDECADVTDPPVEVRSFRTFHPFVAPYRQNADGSLTAYTVPAGGYDDTNQLFSLVITRITKRCGTVSREESETWEYLNPEAARYYWNPTDGLWRAMSTSGPLSTLLVSLGADGTPISDTANPPGEPAYQYQKARWTRTSYTRKSNYYDAPGWGSSDPYGDDRLVAGFVSADDTGYTGRYLGAITRSYSFHNPRVATKDRGPYPDTSFDEIPPIDLVKRLGGGETVQDFYETFRLTNVQVELVSASGAYQQSVEAVQYAYAVESNGNGRYQYSDGSISQHQFTTLQWVGSDKTTYLPTGENQHTAITVPSRLNPTPDLQTTIESGIASAPPPVDYLPGYEPFDPNAFLDEEDQTFGVEARRGETRPIKVTVSADGLLEDHWPSIRKVDYPYAENEDELASAAVEVMRQSMVAAVQLTLPANFLIDEDSILDVTHRPSGLGINKRCPIASITWAGGPLQPTLTNVNLDVYPTS